MEREALLISALGSLLVVILVALTKKSLPTLRVLWAGMRPLSVGDTVWWNHASYLILERSGSSFRFRYKLLDISAVNPWILSALPSNPKLANGANMLWYQGSRGRCYLKKTGHPKIELKTSEPGAQS